jgi:glycolate oxidase iron-sulfur subunit
MLSLAPVVLPPKGPAAGAVFPARGPRRARVALLQGCAQQVLAPRINEATIRLLARNGVEVVLVREEQCCGALTHHMGRDDDALAHARANIDAWLAEEARGGLDAVLVTASGCGTVIKDYGHMLRLDPDYAEKAARISAMARDISEYLADLPITPSGAKPITVAYHSACSLQHAQRVNLQPKQLLAKAGFTVRDIPEAHLCCGSAGTYNLLQPGIAEKLRDRKVANIEAVKPDVIAAGNIGCMTQIGSGTAVPIVHTVELLDWANGGPCPPELAHLDRRIAAALSA